MGAPEPLMQLCPLPLLMLGSAASAYIWRFDGCNVEDSVASLYKKPFIAVL